MHVRSFLAALLLAMLVAPVDAVAQTEPFLDPQGEGTGENGGAGDVRDNVVAPVPDDEAARKAHLDVLLEELADPGNANWQATQAQVYAAWERSGSPSMDFLAQRADEAIADEDYETALVHLNDLTRLAPAFAEGWNKRATVHFLRDDYGRSLEDIAKTLALEPRHFGAYSGLGIILDRLGDKKGALKAYRRAVAIHPHLPGAADGIKKLTREVEGERL
jgi:Flp pilus assembly protein TadD